MTSTANTFGDPRPLHIIASVCPTGPRPTMRVMSEPLTPARNTASYAVPTPQEINAPSSYPKLSGSIMRSCSSAAMYWLCPPSLCQPYAALCGLAHDIWYPSLQFFAEATPRNMIHDNPVVYLKVPGFWPGFDNYTTRLVACYNAFICSPLCPSMLVVNVFYVRATYP